MDDPTMVVYGAGGHSGRRVLAQALKHGGFHVLAAGRSPDRLAALARGLPGLRTLCFPLEDIDRSARALEAGDVVINAAGPFRATAVPLLMACLRTRCHDVDIGGEIDAYCRLHAYWASAACGPVAVVGAAGYTAAAADLLVRAALATLRPGVLASVRVAYADLATLSNGSTATALNVLGLPVVVSVDRRDDRSAGWIRTLTCEPVGRLERRVEFLQPVRSVASDDASAPYRRSLAAAASLVDTAVVRQTVEASGFAVTRVESYLEMAGWARLGYQAGALAASLGVAAPAGRAVQSLGPAACGRSPHAIVLEIDSDVGEPLVRWQLDVDDVYLATAELAVETAAAVAIGPRHPFGWLTPAAAFGDGAGVPAAMLDRVGSFRVRRR